MTGDRRRLIAFLKRHRRRYAGARATQALVMMVAALAWILALLAALFAAFPWVGFPFIAAMAGAGGALTGFWVLIGGVAYRPGLGKIAAMLEQREGRPHQTIGVALELAESGFGSASPELVDRAIGRACAGLDAYAVPLLPWARKRPLAWAASGLALVVSVSALLEPSLWDYRAVPFSILTEVGATLEPGSIAVPRGARVDLSCVPGRRDFPSARLGLLTSGSAVSSSHLLRPDSAGVFAFRTAPLVAGSIYRFMLGGRTFGPETLTVVPPPSLYSLRVTLEPPAYTGRPPAPLREGQGTIVAYAGTRAHFVVESMFPLRSAAFVPRDGDSTSLTVEGDSARGTVQLWRSQSYTFAFEDTLGQRNDSLPSFFVDILPDYPPSVRIIKPGMNRALAPEQSETLWVEGVDDIGLRTMALHWQTGGGSDSDTGTVDLTPPGRREAVLRREYLWNLRDLSLYPGDTVYYWARARDTKPYGSPQVAVSDTFWFRVPGIREIHEEIARKESYAEKTVDAVKEQHETIQRKLESFVKSAQGSRELSWEEKKVLEDLGRSMEQQADSLEQAVEALKEAVEQMKEQGVLTEELARKMDEVRKSLQELIEEYGDSLFFEPPKPDETLSWNDVRDAVEKMKNMLPNLEQRLEQALKYLEMMKKDQKLASLAAKAEKLADRQLGLSMSEEKDLARQQENLARDMEDFMKEMAEASDELGEDQALTPENVPSMEEARAQLDAMKQRMSRGQMPSRGQMGQMSGSLQAMAEQMRSMLSDAQMAQFLKEREKLLDMAADALDMAKWQKGLQGTVQKSEEQALSAAAQQGLRDALRKSMGKLDSLKTTPPSMMRDIMKNMDAAMASMEGVLSSMSGGQQPGGAMGQAAASLNGLAGSLMASADAMGQCAGNCQGGMGGGMMAGLRKLSGKQAALNSATSELLRQLMEGQQQGSSMGGSAEGNDPRQVAEAREAARRAQQEIADGLRRLAEKYGKEMGGGGERAKELEEEARRLAKMLESPTPEIRDRQDRFLVRLLQTTLSTHKQDEGKEERKSTSARTIYTEAQPVPAGEAFRDVDTFYKLRSRALEGNFPESYRMSVQSYFDSLGTLFLRE